MKVILSNGAELTALNIIGEKRNVQGARRDCLVHVFAGGSLDEIDALFTAENCEKITLIDENNDTEAIYTGYTIRADISKSTVEVAQATATTEAQYESRITVTMAERTYAETQLAKLSEELIYTQLALVEVYEGGLV